jgi:hypothetical protein
VHVSYTFDLANAALGVDRPSERASRSRRRNLRESTARSSVAPAASSIVWPLFGPPLFPAVHVVLNDPRSFFALRVCLACQYSTQSSISSCPMSMSRLTVCIFRACQSLTVLVPWSVVVPSLNSAPLAFKRLSIFKPACSSHSIGLLRNQSRCRRFPTPSTAHRLAPDGVPSPQPRSLSHITELSLAPNGALPRCPLSHLPSPSSASFLPRAQQRLFCVPVFTRPTAPRLRVQRQRVCASNGVASARPMTSHLRVQRHRFWAPNVPASLRPTVLRLWVQMCHACTTNGAAPSRSTAPLLYTQRCSTARSVTNAAPASPTASLHGRRFCAPDVVPLRAAKRRSPSPRLVLALTYPSAPRFCTASSLQAL